MHSRIIELSKQKIEVEDYLDVETILSSHDWFLEQIADYIDRTVTRDNDIEWFKKALTSFGLQEATEPEGLLFGPNFKDNYFKDRFEQFKTTAHTFTLQDFQDDFFAYKLKKLIEDKYGFYVYYQERLITFDTFVRQYVKPNTFYYIGGIVDYHC